MIIMAIVTNRQTDYFLAASRPHSLPIDRGGELADACWLLCYISCPNQAEGACADTKCREMVDYS